jgi:RNA polymerase sigma factor (TIGR02999 family)
MSPCAPSELPMIDLTSVLATIERGDPAAAEQLLPLVYDDLRRLAAHKLAREKTGQTLEPTALVHEAYVRLLPSGDTPGGAEQRWDSPGHFFAAAAEAMRRILIDRAREKRSQKRGGGRKRIDIDAIDLAIQSTPDQLLALDDALARLAREDPAAARLVELRYFAGLTVDEAGKALGISTATAYRHWKYARAWLHGELLQNGDV